MTAEQRGGLLADVMAGALAGAGVDGLARRAAQEISHGSESLNGVTVLKVASVTLPSWLKNTLRWAPSRYTDLETVLRSTELVRLVRINGKEVWRIDSGEPMRKDTVNRLVDARMLVAATPSTRLLSPALIQTAGTSCD